MFHRSRERMKALKKCQRLAWNILETERWALGRYWDSCNQRKHQSNTALKCLWMSHGGIVPSYLHDALLALFIAHKSYQSNVQQEGNFGKLPFQQKWMHNLTKIINMGNQKPSPGWLVRLSNHFPSKPTHQDYLPACPQARGGGDTDMRISSTSSVIFMEYEIVRSVAHSIFTLICVFFFSTSSEADD